MREKLQGSPRAGKSAWSQAAPSQMEGKRRGAVGP